VSSLWDEALNAAVEASRSAEFDVDLEVPVEISMSADCRNDLEGAIDMCKSAADMEEVVWVTASAVGDKDLELATEISTSLKGAVEISASAIGDKHIVGGAAMRPVCPLVEFR
jgi:hypothetical protein